jgi:hypothetical protein
MRSNPRRGLQSERLHEEIIEPTKRFVDTHPAGTRANPGAGLSRSHLELIELARSRAMRGFEIS